MRILQLRKWLSAKDDNGGKQRATGLARALSRFAQVDAIGFSDRDPSALCRAPRLTHYRRLIPVTPPAPGARALRFALELGGGSSLRTARFSSPDYRRCVAAALGADSYDAVQVEELSMFANLGESGLSRPLVYSAHNVESDLVRQLLRARGALLKTLVPLELRRGRREERRALRTARFSLTVSTADKCDLEELGGARIHVVPNCVDDDIEPAPASLSASESPRRVAFVACFSWYPNEEGTRWFLSDVLPHVRSAGSACVVDFVGSGIAPRLAAAIRAAGCRVAEDVPDTLPHLARARVAMVPLLSGGGTRLKIVEAWAAGVPVVSTPLGAAGLDAADGTDILLAREPAAFAAALARVLVDDALYHRLRDHGVRRAQSLRWEKQAAALEALYATLR
jgi:glycosyltransferase involved in cell wall biosynthesis